MSSVPASAVLSDMRHAWCVSSYKERLRVSFGWWTAALAMALVFGWIFGVVSGVTFGIEVAVVSLVLLAAALMKYGALTIAVDAEGLTLGRAHLDAASIGAVEALEPAPMREWLGTRADARAYIVIRPYLKRGVRVMVDDPSDPAPYWLISTRRPAELVAALGGTEEDQTNNATIGDNTGVEEE